MSKLKIIFDPVQRMTFIQQLLKTDGLGHITEDPNVGYGIIALTGLGTTVPSANERLESIIIALTGLGTNVASANERVKGYLGSRQSILRAAMGRAGITLYDPASAPYSPDKDLTASPNQVFMVDTARVGMARHVSFVDVLPTTGGGIELEKARRMGKFLSIFHDPSIRTSRMQPDRALHLMANNFGQRRGDLAELFEFLQEYDPCIGTVDEFPTMIGMHRQTGIAVNLEEAVRTRWPHLAYAYDGRIPILIMACQNPDLFLEERGVRLESTLLTCLDAPYVLTTSHLGNDPVDAVLIRVGHPECIPFDPFSEHRGPVVTEQDILTSARRTILRNMEDEHEPASLSDSFRVVPDGITGTVFDSEDDTPGKYIIPTIQSIGPVATFCFDPISGTLTEAMIKNGRADYASVPVNRPSHQAYTPGGS